MPLSLLVSKWKMPVCLWMISCVVTMVANSSFKFVREWKCTSTTLIVTPSKCRSNVAVASRTNRTWNPRFPAMRVVVSQQWFVVRPTITTVEMFKSRKYFARSVPIKAELTFLCKTGSLLLNNSEHSLRVHRQSPSVSMVKSDRLNHVWYEWSVVELGGNSSGAGWCFLPVPVYSDFHPNAMDHEKPSARLSTVALRRSSDLSSGSSELQILKWRNTFSGLDVPSFEKNPHRESLFVSYLDKQSNREIRFDWPLLSS